MASPPTLASTNGIWLIAAFLQAMLQGMGLLQGFLYFMWYPKDTWSIKGTVIAMLLIESVQMGAAISNVYVWFVEGFGNFDNLNTIHWQDTLQLTALYLSTFVAQAHFARTIYHLHRQNIVIPVLVLLLSMAALASGMVQVGLIVGIKKYSDLGKTSASSNLQAAFSLAADMLITVGLCWRLYNSRTGIQSTNRILNFLVITAINRGVFTMLFAVLNVVLFLSQPGTFYFMLALLLSDKFYMNSMLAVLNTRQHAFKMHGKHCRGVNFYALFLGQKQHRANGITVSTTLETSRDNLSDSDADGKFSV